MIIVDARPEEKFKDKIAEVAQRRPSYKCLEVLCKNDAHDIAFISKSMEKIFTDTERTLFQCFDGHLYFVGESLSPREVRFFTDVVAHLGVAIRVLDLGEDWLVLSNRVLRLQDKREFAEEKKRVEADRQRAEKVRQSVLNAPVDAGLVASIPQRRQDRSSFSIMVAEDDAFSRQLVSTALSKNFMIETADDALSAIAKYISRAPDVLFLDIDMPDASGIDVLQRIMAIDPTACVVMLSGHGSRENIVKSIALGAKGFIGKPFTRDKLMQYIHKFAVA